MLMVVGLPLIFALCVFVTVTASCLHVSIRATTFLDLGKVSTLNRKVLFRHILTSSLMCGYYLLLHEAILILS